MRLAGLGLDRYARRGATLVFLGILWAVFGSLEPVFLSRANLNELLLSSSTLAIVAAGLTVVMISGEFDLSIGSVEGMTGAATALLILSAHVPTIPAIVCGLMIGGAIGVINGLATWKLRVPSFIATLAMLGIAQGAAFLVTNANTVSGLPHTFLVIGTGVLFGVPVPIIITVCVYLGLHVMLNSTRFGLRLYAVGGNPESAALAGVNPGRIRLRAFVISGCLAALAGLILSARLNAANGNFGQNDLLLAVAGVVIGGTSLFGGSGSVVGTALGILIIGSVENGLVLLNMQQFWQEIVVGSLILVAVVVDRAMRSRLTQALIER